MMSRSREGRHAMRFGAAMTVEHDAYHCHIVHKRRRNATTEVSFDGGSQGVGRGAARRAVAQTDVPRVEAISLSSHVLQLNCTVSVRNLTPMLEGKPEPANHSFLKFWKVSRC